MRQKSRIEIVVENMIAKGSTDVKQATWRYLRSESARAEAEMINVSHQAQLDVISVIGKITGEDLISYKTDSVIKEAQSVLEKMIGDSEILANTMVTANILSGKVNAVIKSTLIGQPLIDAITLKEPDYQRIERLVNQIIGRLQNGASLTIASIKNTIQTTAVKANMPASGISQSTTKEKKDEDKIKQEPLPNSFVAESISIGRPQRQYKRPLPTKKELELISKNPIQFATQESKVNVTVVTRLRNEYFKPKDSPLNSSKQREKALKEINGSPAAKAVFDMNEQLRKQGLSAFTDKGGRRWSLESYCAMTTRTTASQSSNLGEVFADSEHDLYYIVPHGGSCPICAKYEGRVYSRSGTNPNYPSLASVFSKIDPNGSNDLDNTYLTIHPNCRHKIIPYIEKSHTKAQQKKIQQNSNKPFEIDEKKKKEIDRYKIREKAWNDRVAAMREFQMYLQVLPPKDVCGNFIRFYEHKQKNDSVYKEVKRKYNEAIKPKQNKETSKKSDK